MLSINMDDVMQVVSNIKNYLIAFGVVLVLALIVMFAVRKKPKAKKKLIRAQSGVAILLALAIVANLICTGPMSTMLDLVSVSGTISEETSAEATQLVNEITQEGVVLAQNEDNILPVASGSKLNVFGWSSTNPCYGGTGSGALNDAYPVTDLLTGQRRTEQVLYRLLRYASDRWYVEARLDSAGTQCQSLYQRDDGECEELLRYCNGRYHPRWR